jgi:predicted PurR-regulated permease PerM
MRLWRTSTTHVPPAAGLTRRAEIERATPVSVEIAGGWAWRILAITAVIALFVFLVASVKEIAIPFLVALLIAALLTPFVNLLRRHHWPHWLAIVVALLLTVVVVGGLLFLVVTQIRAGLPGLEKKSVTSYDNFKAFLKASPLQVSNADFTAYLDKGLQAIQKSSAALFSGALKVGETVGRLVTGALIALFSTIFLLIDGPGVWHWITRLFPRRARVAVDGAGQAGWLTLTTFVRVQLLVAAVDAIGVGLFALFLGLPLALPIAVIVFLASFIPVVGAIATGVIAVVVALVYVGPIQALIMLGGVLVVHLLEAHVLQPLVMGSAVKVHPLAVVLSVATGSYLAGIPGALFAVPIVAVLNVMITFIARGDWRREPKTVAERQAAAVATPPA